MTKGNCSPGPRSRGPGHTRKAIRGPARQTVESESAWNPGRGEQAPGPTRVPAGTRAAVWGCDTDRRTTAGGVRQPSRPPAAGKRHSAAPGDGAEHRAAVDPVSRRGCGRGPGRASRERPVRVSRDGALIRLSADRPPTTGRQIPKGPGRRIPGASGLPRGRFRLSGRHCAGHAEQRAAPRGMRMRILRRGILPRPARGKSRNQYSGRYGNQPSRFARPGHRCFRATFRMPARMTAPAVRQPARDKAGSPGDAEGDDPARTDVRTGSDRSAITCGYASLLRFGPPAASTGGASATATFSSPRKVNLISSPSPSVPTTTM